MNQTLIVDEEYADWEREIVEIEHAHGEVTPELVLWKASQKGSALHGQFQWDDTQAANEYRLLQASGLIRRVKVKIVDTSTEEEREARRYTNVVVRTDEVERRVYAPITQIVKSEELTRQMLDDAMRSLASFRRKYATLSQLAKVFAVIDELEGAKA